MNKNLEQLTDSVTLKLNAKAVAMAKSGQEVFNLTAGQLPFRPPSSFVEMIQRKALDLESYQYSPAAGFPGLRSRCLEHFFQSRKLEINPSLSCLLSNGGKHALSNLFSGLLNPGDEVILLAPYWVSYPEMIKLSGAKQVTLSSSLMSHFTPDIDELKDKINSKTKFLILNSPNNPSGIHYSPEWMKQLGEVLLENPECLIISDEIYFDLVYFDPSPTYFYQDFPELLERTFIIDGISKFLASTGLRLGITIGPEKYLSQISKLQAHTASGPNSLVQRALNDLERSEVENFLGPVKSHLRKNAEYLKKSLQENGHSSLWYQVTSAFYFLLSLSETAIFKRLREKYPEQKDLSFEVCQELLDQKGVAIVPGGAFGVPNSARMSLVLDEEEFQQAVNRLIEGLS